MTEQEAYRLGYELALTAPGIKLKELRLPPEIEPKTPQATAYRLGYRDGLRARPTPVRPW